MNALNLLICPVCGESLAKEGASLLCRNPERRHCYDFASSGYINLLPPGKEKNARTGDEKHMIHARSAFLDAGYYAPLSDKVGELIAKLCRRLGKREISVVDAGSGEGYHTCNILKNLSERGIDSAVLGFDASKYGAESGAKRARSLFGREADFCLFAAGNIFALPIRDHAVDFAVSMFAPVAGKEALRYLKDDGRLIVVSAGERHLFELRELLYDEPRTSSGCIPIPEGFEKEGEERLRYFFTVKSNDELRSLFTMTPFYYKTSLSDKAKLDGVRSLGITADVKYTVLRKTK